jgi:predicted transcriptional regulator
MCVIPPEKLPRCLSYFDKITEKCIGKVSIPEVELRQIQKLWNEPEDEPMVDCYPLNTKEQIVFFEKIISAKLNLDVYDYFLEVN